MRKTGAGGSHDPQPPWHVPSPFVIGCHSTSVRAQQQPPVDAMLIERLHWQAVSPLPSLNPKRCENGVLKAHPDIYIACVPPWRGSTCGDAGAPHPPLQAPQLDDNSTMEPTARAYEITLLRSAATHPLPQELHFSVEIGAQVHAPWREG